MYAQLKQRWIEALRSGDYEQGKGYLRVGEYDQFGNERYRYCCLGVLCNLIRPEGWDYDLDEDTGRRSDVLFLFFTRDSGEHYGNGSLEGLGDLFDIPQDIVEMLARLNDKEDPLSRKPVFDFNAIADIIEAGVFA